VGSKGNVSVDQKLMAGNALTLCKAVMLQRPRQIFCSRSRTGTVEIVGVINTDNILIILMFRVISGHPHSDP